MASIPIVFEITKKCLQAGLRSPGEDGCHDTLDNLSEKLRGNQHVLDALGQVMSGEAEKVTVVVRAQ